MTRHIPLAFPLVIGAIGIVLIAYSTAILRETGAAVRWPTVKGIVYVSEIRPVEQTKAKKQRLILYDAVVEYGYEVKGRRYLSQRVRIDLPVQSDPADAQRLVERYPANSTVRVFYNPGDPAEAVLEPGRNPQTASLLASGIVLAIVAGVMLAVRGWRR